jgi:hypothetical protein
MGGDDTQNQPRVEARNAKNPRIHLDLNLSLSRVPAA